MLPLQHLSASSVNTFLRCPLQWQDKYIRGNRRPPSGAIVIGSAVHLALSRLMTDQPLGNYWEETIAEAIGGYGSIAWNQKDTPETAPKTADTMVYHYWELVGKYLKVEDVEMEFSLEVPGVDIPVIGFVDLVTINSGIDYKTTGYLNRNVKLNPEWKLQSLIYQLKHNKPSELHVITRSKTDPVIVPDSVSHKLYIPVADKEKTEKVIRDAWFQMNYFWHEFGAEVDWPGAPTHDWAAKYCDVCRETGGCQL